jgi:hypothetical protein
MAETEDEGAVDKGWRGRRRKTRALWTDGLAGLLLLEGRRSRKAGDADD